jgi:uncharacterized membrane protein YuzA (DUF378 family)
MAKEMVIKINGKVINQPKVESYYEPVLVKEAKAQETVSKIFGHHLLPISTAAGVMWAKSKAFAASAVETIANPQTTVPSAAGAKGLGAALIPIIHMIQDLALPTGIIVASWGLIEIMIGNPNGKTKIKYAIIGFVGLFIVPSVFYAIRDAFAGIL